jgi:carbonic anhydrase/acetyltransferase-like protein (isoleucine patch superfamily)
MICASCEVHGRVQVGAGSALQPLCRVTSSGDGGTIIGERCVLEETCEVHNSSMQHGNVIHAGAKISESSVSAMLCYVLL